MKRRFVFLLSVLAVVLILTAFMAGNAYATTGCFTDINGHWAETFICWMKDNGITGGVGGGLYQPEGLVTRAQMAVFMKAQADVPPTIGDTQITFGPNEWQANAAYPSGYVKYFTIWNHLQSTAIGTVLFQATPALPSGIYNKLIFVKGVQICYNATTGGYIDLVQVEHYKTNDDGSTITLNTLADTTDRTDATCRQYYFATPSSFFGDNHVTIKVYHQFNTTADILMISSTSVIISPSGAPASITGPQMDVPGIIPATGPETGQ